MEYIIEANICKWPDEQLEWIETMGFDDLGHAKAVFHYFLGKGIRPVRLFRNALVAEDRQVIMKAENGIRTGC